MVESDSTLKLAATAPNLTPVAPVKLAPVMVTVIPGPAMLGVMEPKPGLR